jgi:TetR/AcrR family transcriptional repressor of nem operon
MKRGRPKSYQREVMLQKAMEYFWEHGYDGSSLSDLIEAMEIGRQSLYNEFGGKRELFVESLKHYLEQWNNKLTSRLEAPDAGLDSVREVLAMIENSQHSNRGVGCFAVNSAVEFGAEDEDVAALLRQNANRMTHLFRQALERANEAGDMGGMSSGCYVHAGWSRRGAQVGNMEHLRLSSGVRVAWHSVATQRGSGLGRNGERVARV